MTSTDTRAVPEARCAPTWRDADRVAAGTAPIAGFWVAVEQPGPWGRAALTDSRLDPDAGRRLDDAVSRHGGRAVLVRRPDAHADGDAPRTLLVAADLAGLPVLGRRVVPAAGVVAAIDELIAALDDVVAGRLPGGFEPAPAVLLVCSNGKRDRCCSIEARPLLRELSDADLPGEVWESSHLNGHRFAPTAVALPTGQMGAWLTASDASELLRAAAAGRLWAGGVHRERGRSHLAPGVQAVDVVVRSQLGEVAPDALSFEPEEALGTGGAGSMVGRTAAVGVHDRNGRAWNLDVTALAGQELPESCGKKAVPTADWSVREAASAN